MATRKTTSPAPAKGSAVAVRKPSAGNIVSIQEALKKEASELVGRIAPGGGNKIRITQDKKFVLPDGTKTEGPLKLVVVDFVTTHNFYEGPYDKDNIVPPGCFAIGLNPKDMTPSPNSPNMQSDSCQGCPMNEFGSSGKGKACNNGRLLAVMEPDADADSPIWTLGVSPTALRGFDGYVGAVNRVFGLPPISVVTNVSFSDGADYPQLVFSDPVPNENLNTHFGRKAEAREMLFNEPDVSGYQPPGKKVGVKSAVVKKPTNGHR